MPRPDRVRLRNIKKVGFVVKHHNPDAASLAIELSQFVLREEIGVVFAKESAAIARELTTLLKAEKKSQRRVQVLTGKEQIPDVADVIIVLGGDGTYLSIARLMKSRSIPVMGINMGQLGFLTEIKRSEALDAVSQMLAGEAMLISERALLEVTLHRKNRVIFQGPVVNDAVISKGAIARIIGMQIGINGRLVNTMRADGIIVSTPTGSTAYSLAAGGPILSPHVPGLVITPICPHALTQRPLVVPDSSEIQIRLNDRPGHVLLTLDGQDAVDMKEDDLVTIRRFTKHNLKLISSPTRDYFSLLREKLKFGLRE
jgi:NAD+ kinase